MPRRIANCYYQLVPRHEISYLLRTNGPRAAAAEILLGLRCAAYQLVRG